MIVSGSIVGEDKFGSGVVDYTVVGGVVVLTIDGASGAVVGDTKADGEVVGGDIVGDAVGEVVGSTFVFDDVVGDATG